MVKLLVVSFISFLFMAGEFTGGYLSGSLAIMTDAAHMLSDVAGFMISYFAIHMGTRPTTFNMSFGYHRAEILGAMASIILIWGLVIWLIVEAIERVVNPTKIDGFIMLITAIVGLICNIINIFTLHSCGGGHSHHNIDEEHHEHGEHGEHEHGEHGHDNSDLRKLSHCHLPVMEQIIIKNNSRKNSGNPNDMDLSNEEPN
jgi:zinc transporter 2